MIYLPFTNRKSVPKKTREKITNTIRPRGRTIPQQQRLQWVRTATHHTRTHSHTQPKREGKYLRYNFAQAIIFYSEICTESKQWKMLLVRSAITYKVSRHKGVMQQNALLCYVCDFDLGRVRYAHTRNRHAQKYVSVRNGFTSVLFPFASVWQQICALLIEIRSTCTHTHIQKKNK